MYSKRFEEIANEIENLRLEIYRNNHINVYDKKDKAELDDLLFSIQSKLHYDVKEILQCYEEDDLDITPKYNQDKQLLEDLRLEQMEQM